MRKFTISYICICLLMMFTLGGCASTQPNLSEKDRQSVDKAQPDQDSSNASGSIDNPTIKNENGELDENIHIPDENEKSEHTDFDDEGASEIGLLLDKEGILIVSNGKLLRDQIHDECMYVKLTVTNNRNHEIKIDNISEFGTAHVTNEGYYVANCLGFLENDIEYGVNLLPGETKECYICAVSFSMYFLGFKSGVVESCINVQNVEDETMVLANEPICFNTFYSEEVNTELLEITDEIFNQDGRRVLGRVYFFDNYSKNAEITKSYVFPNSSIIALQIENNTESYLTFDFKDTVLHLKDGTLKEIYRVGSIDEPEEIPPYSKALYIIQISSDFEDIYTIDTVSGSFAIDKPNSIAMDRVEYQLKNTSGINQFFENDELIVLFGRDNWNQSRRRCMMFFRNKNGYETMIIKSFRNAEITRASGYSDLSSWGGSAQWELEFDKIPESDKFPTDKIMVDCFWINKEGERKSDIFEIPVS